MNAFTPDDVARSIPRLAVAVQVFQEAGATRLRGPLLRRNPLSRAIAWLLRLPRRVDVELDDIGAWVVARIDGRITLQALARDLAAHLRLTSREAETALTAFVQALLQRRLLVLDGLSGRRA